MNSRTPTIGFFAALLILAGTLLATLSVPVVWLHEVVLDTDDYVNTVAPLSENPVVKDAVADFATDEFLERVNAEQLAELSLPENLEFMADPLLGTLDGYIYGQVREELDSPRFSRIWMETNRGAHASVLQLMLGEPGSLQANGGKVSLDMALLLNEISDALAAKGIFVFAAIEFPEGSARFVIFESPLIARAQQVFSWLDRLFFWLPLAAGASFAAAALISRKPLQTVAWGGLGTGAGMIGLMAVTSLVQGEYLSAVSGSGSIDAAAAGAFLDVMSDSLRGWLRAAMAVSLGAALVTFAAGLVNRFR